MRSGRSHTASTSRISSVRTTSRPSPSSSGQRPNTPPPRMRSSGSKPTAASCRRWAVTPHGHHRPRTRSCRCSWSTRRSTCRFASASTPTGIGSGSGAEGSGCPNVPTHPGSTPRCSRRGVHSTCVEFTNHFGLGDERNLQPLKPHDGPTLFPLDRAIVDLMWGRERVPVPALISRLQPSHASRPSRSGQRRQPIRPRACATQAQADAREFVSAVKRRVAGGWTLRMCVRHRAPRPLVVRGAAVARGPTPRGCGATARADRAGLRHGRPASGGCPWRSTSFLPRPAGDWAAICAPGAHRQSPISPGRPARLSSTPSSTAAVSRRTGRCVN